MIAPFLLLLLASMSAPSARVLESACEPALAPVPLAVEYVVTPLLDLQPQYAAHYSLPNVPPTGASTFRLDCIAVGTLQVEVKNLTRAPVQLYQVLTTVDLELAGTTISVPAHLGNVMPILPGETQIRTLLWWAPLTSSPRPLSSWTPSFVATVPQHYVTNGLSFVYNTLDTKLIGLVTFE